MGAEYRFRSTWWLPAVPASRVFDAVVDLESYPRWWADVRSVRQVDGDTAELVCRSRLPYRLVIAMHREQQDPRAGHVRVRLTGDLEGFLSGDLQPVGEGTRLVITQQVRARKPLLRKLDVVARPFFRANHAWMMRRGHRGLAAYLA
ncbi:SRPBCC family protein [Amycolatopsis saalfeldensis]|uniref:Polyketide cyclase / dehydrase and lipid transport n=1 Tax=Amycolatopsis saalfeldensis TaxID=394193 RepID=A0A1H8W1V8_9PSEU|nr:SRPBCC family protein [Amycolatopsis saalfeldensis]SEP21600.1 Polyketide cyclase / dehydrase and lipid transport [Amycolatopsis saalfeldensis]